MIVMRQLGLLLLIFLSTALEGRLADLSKQAVSEKVEDILKAHATFKELNPTLMERILNNYIEQLDPLKIYFTLPEIANWLHPDQEQLALILRQYRQSNFESFAKIYALFVQTIERHRQLQRENQNAILPLEVKIDEFKEAPWCKNVDELKTRLLRIQALQTQAAAKMEEGFKEKALQRIEKRQLKFEEESQYKQGPLFQEKFILEQILKATASALDTHTSYFTPAEARQFMIGVQQRLFGIGAQLRDDLNGFTVVKIIDGGPAFRGKALKAKDRIIAVDGEPVVGLDIQDAVELIRGQKGSQVVLKVVREEEGQATQTLDIAVERGEVVLKETRLSTHIEPFGSSVIAHLRLHSFYQDPESSSAEDLAKELANIRKQHALKGVILDLRHNAGGLLSQAVAVSGLFITKGIIVSIKDETGKVKHLRDLDGKMAWEGPLIVLVNRASASAAEIVAQSLQDYGRAIVVGDEHTYGKGSFQTFTLQAHRESMINPEGEFKVTRGKYYTVSGKSPQLIGVASDIVVPSALSGLDMGEKFAKYPLANDAIQANFEDSLDDIPFLQRERIKRFYKSNLQQKISTFIQHLPLLQQNSKTRIAADPNYQLFLKEVQKDWLSDEVEVFGQNDLQMIETLNIMKDLIFILTERGKEAI